MDSADSVRTAAEQSDRPADWLDRPGEPRRKLDDEQGQGVTVAYEQLLESGRQKKR